jgi:hypothetical protein
MADVTEQLLNYLFVLAVAAFRHISLKHGFKSHVGYWDFVGGHDAIPF